MLSEVFGAVLSRRGIRATLWLSLLALLFTLAGAAVLVPWLVANGFPTARFRLLAPANPAFTIATLVPVAVALFLLAAYAHTALIDLARRLRAGERPDIEGALRGKRARTLSYAGGYLLFDLVVQGVGVAVLVAVIAAFVLGGRIPALSAPGAAAGPTRIPVVQGSPPPIDLGTLGNAPIPVTLPLGLIGAILLGFLFFLVWGAYFAVRLTFFRYAVAVDGERAVAALKASWRLTRGRWWPLFGTFLLLGLVLAVLAVVAAFVVAIPFSLVAAGSVVGLLIFGVAFGVAFQVLWYLFAVPALFYGGLAAYEELKRPAGPAPPAVSVPPPPPSPA